MVPGRWKLAVVKHYDGRIEELANRMWKTLDANYYFPGVSEMGIREHGEIVKLVTTGDLKGYSKLNSQNKCLYSQEYHTVQFGRTTPY